MFGKIVVCSDGSSYALGAVRAAGILAKMCGAELLLLIVFDPSRVRAPFIGVPGAALDTATDDGAYAEQVLTSIERSAGEALDSLHVPYRTLREFGHPAERILSAACDEDAGLLVLGCRGLSKFAANLVGSVSQTVLERAHCSVLVAR